MKKIQPIKNFIIRPTQVIMMGTSKVKPIPEAQKLKVEQSNVY